MPHRLVPTALPAGQNPQSVSTADFNGDGRPDLMVANQGNGPGGGVSVLLGNGDGTFQSPVHYATGSNTQHAVVGDVNGDGHPDLISANENSNDVSVLLGNGDGSFQTAVTGPAGSLPLGLAAGDGFEVRLFDDEQDPLTVMKWKETLDFLEDATDRCEDVANVLEGVVVKHA